jgi:hypothetical protein
MDGSHVGSPDRQTHLLHLEACFNALATNGLALNLEKCVFVVPSLKILSHMILATGSTPTADHAAKIESCPPPPQDIKQLQYFLGIVNFYRHFWLNFFCTGVAVFNRSPEGGAQNVGVNSPSRTSLSTDAFDTHIDGIMQQKSRGPLAATWFFLQKID